MKKKKLPKYIQEKFKKPQFKPGDIVKWEFLGESGWGVVKKILNTNDKITYMVKTGKYTYPCGIQIKEYSSYYAGSIDYETSKNRQIMARPEFQQLKHEMTIKQGNDFLDLMAIQYQIQDLDLSQRMTLGLAMEKTYRQIQEAENQIKIQN